MKVMLDACVLYPTVMREVLLGAARAGLYEPQWSNRILEEWARAAARHGSTDEVSARATATMMNVNFPRAVIKPSPDLEKRLWLPDAFDIHVLAAAIRGSSDTIVTMNAKDFPRNILAEEGLRRDDPDIFLWTLAQEYPDTLLDIVMEVKATADVMSGSEWTVRALMKKARLPRLGKLLET
jgi:hypothetical protein